MLMDLLILNPYDVSEAPSDFLFAVGCWGGPSPSVSGSDFLFLGFNTLDANDSGSIAMESSSSSSSSSHLLLFASSSASG